MPDDMERLTPATPDEVPQSLAYACNMTASAISETPNASPCASLRSTLQST